MHCSAPPSSVSCARRAGAVPVCFCRTAGAPIRASARAAGCTAHGALAQLLGVPLRARRVRHERGGCLHLTAGAYSRAFSAHCGVRALLCHAWPPTLTPLARVAPRSMADASEAEQLAVVDAAAEQRDVASIAQLTRAASSAAVSEAGCAALRVVFHADDECRSTLEETQLAVEALVSALNAQPASANVQRDACLVLAFMMCGKTYSSDVRAVAGAVGAVEAVTTALRAHAEDGDVLDAACLALASLVLHLENCRRAHCAGALNALLNNMRARPTHERLQQSGCSALSQMCENIIGISAEAVCALVRLLSSSACCEHFRAPRSKRMHVVRLPPCFLLSRLVTTMGCTLLRCPASWKRCGHMEPPTKTCNVTHARLCAA